MGFARLVLGFRREVCVAPMPRFAYAHAYGNCARFTYKTVHARTPLRARSATADGDEPAPMRAMAPIVLRWLRASRQSYDLVIGSYPGGSLDVA
jgi:hypothetical protein